MILSIHGVPNKACWDICLLIFDVDSLHYFAITSDVMYAGVEFSNFTDGGHKTSRAIKGAPRESLFAQFCLHALWFGNCNIRGMYQK